MDLLKRTDAGFHEIYHQLCLFSFSFSPLTSIASYKCQNALFDEENSQKRPLKFGRNCHHQHPNYCQIYACLEGCRPGSLLLIRMVATI